MWLVCGAELITFKILNALYYREIVLGRRVEADFRNLKSIFLHPHIP